MNEMPPVVFSILTNSVGLIFYVTLLFFTIYSVFLAYHWFSYATKPATATLALAIYLLGSAPFFIIMAIML